MVPPHSNAQAARFIGRTDRYHGVTRMVETRVGSKRPTQHVTEPVVPCWTAHGDATCRAQAAAGVA